MPFCRKCGRRIPQNSESCPECGTSTTGAIIKVKKAATIQAHKAVPKTKIAKVVLPTAEKSVIVTLVAPTPQTEIAPPPKTATAAEQTRQTKQNIHSADTPNHKIKQSNLSLEEDIITNPHDYETQIFEFDLRCPHGHFFSAGKALPVSKGKAYCPECGEQLRIIEHQKHHRYHRF